MAFEDDDAPPRRRRGPSPAKTAATRQALVTAALATFFEKGFADTRMSDVAARAGTAKGTIYLYFTDKAALFGAVVVEVLRDARAGRSVPRPRPDEPTGAFLRRIVPPLLSELQRSGRSQVLRLVASEGTRFPELTRVYRQVAIEPVLRMIRIYARRAERRGELRPHALSDQPILMAAPAVIAMLWNGLFAGDEPLDVAAMFEAWLDLVFGPVPER